MDEKRADVDRDAEGGVDGELRTPRHQGRGGGGAEQGRPGRPVRGRSVGDPLGRDEHPGD